jgi:hypothetical protein
VESLVRRVVPDEIDNIDDIMEQFAGREEELIETLRVMQEKSIAQRARAAVQRSAKREAGRANRDAAHDDDEDMESVETDGSRSCSKNFGLLHVQIGIDSITEDFPLSTNCISLVSSSFLHPQRDSTDVTKTNSCCIKEVKCNGLLL